MSESLIKAQENNKIKRLMSVARTDFNADQLLRIMQKTPTKHIYKRPAKGGGEWDYVTGTYVKKVLNYVFGWNWDFEIKAHGTEGDMIWVHGRLTVRTGDTAIVKEQFGRADCKRKKDGSGFLDYGNDLKAASTDALKKCAAELGIASDVYGKEEFREIRREDILNLPTPESKKKKPEVATVVEEVPSLVEDHTSGEEDGITPGGDTPAPVATHLGLEELLARKRAELGANT